MRLIEADAVIHVQTYNEMTEDWCVKETTVEKALNYWADEGCPSTVDAVPVEWIKKYMSRCLAIEQDAIGEMVKEWAERKEE